MNELVFTVIGMIIGVFVKTKTDLWVKKKKSKQSALRDVMESLDAVEGAIHGLYGLYEENIAVEKYESSQKKK